MRSLFLPKCQPKIWRISALPSNKLPGHKSLKFLVGILGETMTSSIHSEFNLPLTRTLLFTFVQGIVVYVHNFHCFKPDEVSQLNISKCNFWMSLNADFFPGSRCILDMCHLQPSQWVENFNLKSLLCNCKNQLTNSKIHSILYYRHWTNK